MCSENVDENAARSSYLTEALTAKPFQTVYNIFWISLLVLFMQSICRDYYQDDYIYLGVRTFQQGFAGIQYALICWCIIHLNAFIVYYGFKLWMRKIFYRRRAAIFHYFVSPCCVLIYLVILISSAILAISCCWYYQLQFPAAMALLMETTRLLMKMHAYMKTNLNQIYTNLYDVAQILQNSPKSFMYFLYAPTLIYNDHYERLTTTIRWRFVAKCCLEIVGVMYFYCFIFELYIKDYFQNFGIVEISLADLLPKLLAMILPNIVIFVLTHYLLLHAVQNLFAELLHYADRDFYADWWHVSNYSDYFRKWNGVVGDWLHEYIYKEVRANLFQCSRIGAAILVITVSALVHEIMLICALRTFMPLLYVLFGVIGVLFLFVKLPKNVGNFFFWFSLALGANLIISFYSIEYYAKINCSRSYNSFSDYFIPSIWICYKKFK